MKPKTIDSEALLLSMRCWDVLNQYPVTDALRICFFDMSDIETEHVTIDQFKEHVLNMAFAFAGRGAYDKIKELLQE